MIFRKIFLVLALSLTLLGFDKVYFLPADADKAKKEIIDLIEDADKKIDIAMYNISYKRLVKALKKAHKKGVQVTIIYHLQKIYAKLDVNFWIKLIIMNEP